MRRCVSARSHAPVGFETGVTTRRLPRSFALVRGPNRARARRSTRRVDVELTRTSRTRIQIPTLPSRSDVTPIPTLLPLDRARSQATSDHLNGSPDWGVNVDMCDLVNSDFYRHGKDTVKALKLKVTKRAKPVKQMLALVALEMCMKNCGAQFHAMVVHKELLFECARLLRGGSCDPDVRAKVAVLVQEWGTQIARVPQYRQTFDDLRSRGVRFPAPDPAAGPHGADATPMYHPRQTTAETIRANFDRMDPADAAAIRAAVAEAEAEVEAEERAARVRRGFAVGAGDGDARSPTSASRGRTIYRDDGMPLNGFPGGAPLPVGSPPRGYDALEDDDDFVDRRRGGARFGGAAAADLLAAQRASREEATAAARLRDARPPPMDATSPEAVAKLKSDLEVARNSAAVLRDMLDGIDAVRDPGAVNDEVVSQLAEQCAQMRPRVVALVESAEDEELLATALELNDELTYAAERRDALRAAAETDPETRAAIAASAAETEARTTRTQAATTTDPVADLVDLLGDAAVASPAAAGAAASTGDPFFAPSSPPTNPVPVPVPTTAFGSPPTNRPARMSSGPSSAAKDVPPLAPPPGSASRGVSSAAVTLDDLLGGDAASSPRPPPPPHGKAVVDPFANPFADPFAASGGANYPPTGGSLSPPSARDPFAAGSASASAVADPFAAPPARSPVNPFAAPSPAGAGYGSMPPAPTPSSGTMSANPLFDPARAATTPSRAPVDPFAELTGSPAGSSGAGMSSPSPSRGTNPFAPR